MVDAAGLATEICDWLKRNPGELYTPSHFFGVAWVRHKTVTIGEWHNENAQRAFTAAMVRHWGGPQVGLALEIQAMHQANISRYLQHGGPIMLEWFTRNPIYMRILRAARETQTEVVAMDENHSFKRVGGIGGGLSTATQVGGYHRDEHMTNAVLELVKRKSKVLVLTGMFHANEKFVGKTPNLGSQLVQALGNRVYTICTMAPRHFPDPFFLAMKSTFGSRGAIAFDVDRSPLRKAEIKDVVGSMSWGAACGGIILFFNG
jgi:hypothetical protein